MKILGILAILSCSLIAFSLVSVGHAQITNADFQQALADYHQAADRAASLAAAEKIIKFAAAMDQLPPIPEEARKHFVMGTTLFKDAKTPDDYSQVESEFKQATDLAPQWPEARYNLALAREAAGNYSGAMADLKFYQQFKLSDSEARTVQDKIYALEAKQKKATKDKELAAQKAAEENTATEARARESSPEAVAVKQQNEYDAWLKKLDGARFSQSDPGTPGAYDAETGSAMIAYKYTVVIRGTHALWIMKAVFANGRSRDFGGATALNIEGRKFHDNSGTFTISDDGAIITYVYSNNGRQRVYTRE